MTKKPKWPKELERRRSPHVTSLDPAFEALRRAQKLLAKRSQVGSQVVDPAQLVVKD